MSRLLGALALAGALLLSTAAPLVAQDANLCPRGEVPQYTAGFADLKAYIGDGMGDPVTCEYPDPNGTGDIHQETTTGLAFWRKATNTPTFTNGTDHWAHTPAGWVTWTGSSIDPPTRSTPPTTPPPVAPPASSIPTVDARERLDACLSRNLPLPDPTRYIPTNYRADLRQTLASELFARGLLLSAGMFGNEPMDVHPAILLYSQNPDAYQGDRADQAYANLYNALDRAKQVSDANLSENCGLVVIRQLIRSEPAIAGLLAIGLVTPRMSSHTAANLGDRIADTVTAYKDDPTSLAYPEDLLLVIGKATRIMR